MKNLETENVIKFFCVSVLLLLFLSLYFSLFFSHTFSISFFHLSLYLSFFFFSLSLSTPSLSFSHSLSASLTSLSFSLSLRISQQPWPSHSDQRMQMTWVSNSWGLMVLKEHLTAIIANIFVRTLNRTLGELK